MIEQIAEALGGVSHAVVYALLAVAVVQIAVQVWALVDLVRADDVAGGRKWLWALAIVFLSNLALGAILYLLIGRKSGSVAEEPSEPAVSADRAQRAVDTLYGPESEQE